MTIKIITWLSIIGIVALLIIYFLLRSVDFTTSQEELDYYFSLIDYEPEFKNAELDDRSIYYMTVGDTSKPAVLFVHGSPGAWSDHRIVFTDTSLINNFRFISIDRPGFGKSGEGTPERSLVKQAEAVAKVLQQENTSAILAGHSYGGPVVVRAAIDYPELTDGLVIVAGSVDPGLEKTKWYQIPVHYKILSWILPRDIYATNEEILALKEELEEMEPLWGQITQPVSVIQGGVDNLVPVGNADYAKKMLTSTTPEMIVIPDMNHFVIWNRPELLVQEIKRIGELNQQKSPTE
ncbi:MAG: alpha/beta hydrolase [Cyanothece sp. SIO1E1]|nr:alpha/beta hydrolase [Cyanothece sp. SIO1E1]